MGCLPHGVGVCCDKRSTGSSLLVEFKARSLAQSTDDANFLAAFQHSATVEGVFYWTAVVWKEVLPVSLLGHLDYGSMSYDLGLQGTFMSGICYFMAEQY